MYSSYIPRSRVPFSLPSTTRRASGDILIHLHKGDFPVFEQKIIEYTESRVDFAGGHDIVNQVTLRNAGPNWLL
jgi:hypothetical protein